jgi:hypothetical protein
LEFFALKTRKIDVSRHMETPLQQAQSARKKTHYALEAKLEMNDVERISEEFFGVKFRAREKTEHPKSALLLQEKAMRFV